MKTNYLGIDVSKDTFDANLKSGVKKFDNSEKGFTELLNHLNTESHCVMEATGPYYMRLACYLFERDISVSVINPHCEGAGRGIALSDCDNLFQQNKQTITCMLNIYLSVACNYKNLQNSPVDNFFNQE